MQKLRIVLSFILLSLGFFFFQNCQNQVRTKPGRIAKFSSTELVVKSALNIKFDETNSTYSKPLVNSDINNNIVMASSILAKTGTDSSKFIGLQDIQLVKFNASGFKSWERNIGEIGAQYFAHSISFDKNGNIYLSGSMSKKDSVSQVEENSGFIAKYNSNGESLWLQKVGNANARVWYIIVNAQMAGDSGGNVFVGGAVEGNFQGDGDPHQVHMFAGEFDVSGVQLEINQFSTDPVFIDGDDALLDSEGSIYKFSCLKLINNFNCSDIKLNKFNHSGENLWSQNLGLTGQQEKFYYQLRTWGGLTIFNLEGKTDSKGFSYYSMSTKTIDKDGHDLKLSKIFNFNKLNPESKSWIYGYSSAIDSQENLLFISRDYIKSGDSEDLDIYKLNKYTNNDSSNDKSPVNTALPLAPTDSSNGE